ncbi:hypothetical protein B0A53_06365 [Rhodotorula sp. CCFEE 5036]|nr:hypothetical protein B0A53_06365 [Rhodotorula sp. CCFEE 5036]
MRRDRHPKVPARLRTSSVLRHVAWRDALLASTPTDYLHPPTHDFSSSPSRAPASTKPQRHPRSGSSPGGSSLVSPSPIGTGSNGPYTPWQEVDAGHALPFPLLFIRFSLARFGNGSRSGCDVDGDAAVVSSGFGAPQQQQQYGHHHAGSDSSSPSDAYSTPASSPLAIKPPRSVSTAGTGAAGRELTLSVSLGANLSGYLGAESSYQYQQFDQPQSSQPQPVYEQQSHFPAFGSPTSDADMMHGIRKSFSTTGIANGPGGGGGNSAGWNGHPLPSRPSNELAAGHDWPVDGAETMGSRQVRHHAGTGLQGAALGGGGELEWRRRDW